MNAFISGALQAFKKVLKLIDELYFQKPSEELLSLRILILHYISMYEEIDKIRSNTPANKNSWNSIRDSLADEDKKTFDEIGKIIFDA